jgi:hypothetical protein
MQPWLQMLSPMLNVRLPASGDIMMDYRPWTNWGEAEPSAGNPQIEEEIFRKVALPGKQLGRLIDAVNILIELAASDHPNLRTQPPRALSEFQSMSRQVINKKLDLQNSIRSDAQRALDQLRSADRQAFSALLAHYQDEPNGPADGACQP